MTTLYGIKNCDTVRQARRWLDARDIDYRFHDLRADGLDAARLQTWLDALGWERVLNRRGTTWRQLDPEQREGLDAQAAAGLMLASPALVKRPVLEHAGEVCVGFNTDDYAQRFG
jgi:arsenate reductase